MGKQAAKYMNSISRVIFLSLILSGCAGRAEKIEPAPASRAASFASPGEAVEALRQAVEAEDRASLLKIFGADSAGLLNSGDEVADKNALEKFSAEFQRKHSVEADSEGRFVVLVGEKSWPFPIPIVSDGKKWSFDFALGREEILDRRIGENELKTIRFLRSFVEAQKIYFKKDRDADGVREYAQKGFSSPGKKDGLYWNSAEGAEQSPFGPLAAEAFREGYRRKGEEPIAYHGYFFKLLTAQGPHAAGGRKNYLDKRSNMTRGFALFAYPVRWGSSGIMSFIVDKSGVVYQKDFGVQTLAVSASIKEFDPDPSWDPVADPNEDAVED